MFVQKEGQVDQQDLVDLLNQLDLLDLLNQLDPLYQ